MITVTEHRTPRAARDEILRVAAVAAALEALTPARTAALGHPGLTLLADNINFQVQTLRLHNP